MDTAYQSVPFTLGGEKETPGRLFPDLYSYPITQGSTCLNMGREMSSCQGFLQALKSWSEEIWGNVVLRNLLRHCTLIIQILQKCTVLGAIFLLKHYDVCFLHSPQGTVISNSAGQNEPSTQINIPSFSLTAGLGDEVQNIALHAGKQDFLPGDKEYSFLSSQ